MRTGTRAIVLSSVLLFAGTILSAQKNGNGEPGEAGDTIFFHRQVGVGAGAQIMPAPGAGPAVGYIAGAAADHVMFLSAEMGFESRTVVGAPYAAAAVTEHVQTLADGNKITNRSTSSIYRDGAGRTRRVQTPAAIGPFAAMGGFPETVFINDPVAGASYVLDSRSKTARKIQLPPFMAGSKGVAVPLPETFIKGDFGPTFERALPAPASESLGRQWIEGVAADGTRTTITIPAGEIGNERPIEIVTERWFSPDLQTVVLSRHSDPRMGENLYRLSGISRTEPDPALFRVPDDYRIVEGPGPQMFQKAIEGIKR